MGLFLFSAAAASAEPSALAGAKVFETNCQVCHQAGGVGVEGAFPRLAGRAPTIASSPDGRRFLAQLVLNGMSGGVTVDGQKIMGVMPGFGQLGDDELASVLSYVETLGAPKHKPAPFKASDLAAARSAGRLSPGDMSTLRNSLADRKLIP
jgi:mono/diheme cytochrome c family protein